MPLEFSIWNHPAVTATAHILLFTFVILYPFYGAWSLERDRRRLGSLTTDSASDWRRSAYREIVATQWLVTAVVLFLVLNGSYSPADFGLVLQSGWATLLGFAFVLLASGVLIHQVRGHAKSAAQREKTRQEIGDFEILMPRRRRELGGFALVSLTAGFCEELIYRGFLLAVLSPFVGVWAAVLLQALIFGLGHIYQGGLRGLARTATIGLGFAALVALSGSIWPAVVLHVVIDLAGGYMGFLCLRNQTSPPGAPSPSENVDGPSPDGSRRRALRPPMMTELPATEEAG